MDERGSWINRFIREEQEERRRRACMEKLTWRSRDEALAARAYAAHTYGGSSGSLKPYRCGVCGHWHLARA